VVLNGDDFMAARDPLGVKPLYYGLDERGRMYFASEMKSITDQCVTLSTFPPGHFYTAGSGFVKYFRPEYEDYLNANQELDLAAINATLTNAVRKRLMADVPLGVLLRWIRFIASCINTARLLKEEDKKIHSFAIGLDANAPML
jgi:asparagine synthase (glutamine-hydrolysing)